MEKLEEDDEKEKEEEEVEEDEEEEEIKELNKSKGGARAGRRKEDARKLSASLIISPIQFLE